MMGRIPTCMANGRIAQVNGANTEYFLGDALGSVRQMTDAVALLAGKVYDPYGAGCPERWERSSSYGYTGEQQDAATGMVYLRARHYSPSTGRFLTRDSWERGC